MGNIIFAKQVITTEENPIVSSNCSQPRQNALHCMAGRITIVGNGKGLNLCFLLFNITKPKCLTRWQIFP